MDSVKRQNINMTLWRIFVVRLLMIFVDATRPDIVDEILPEVKQKNQIGYLNCTVVNKGTESVVQWTKSQTVNGGNPVLLSEDDKIVYQGINEDSGLDKYDVQSRVNGRRITYMLVIRYLAEDDAGDYLCTIKIQGVEWTDWPKKIGKLTVKIAPQIQPSINSAYELEIGSNLQLVCESHGIPSPNITWKREDGQELPMGGFQSRGAQMNLTDIQKNDRGNYICVADNNVKPPDDFKVEVVVFYPPSCRPVQSVVGQAQYCNAMLECIVEGFPQPSMRWMKETENGKRTEITDDDKYDITKQFSSQLQNDEFWYTLLVKNVKAKDYTKYYCVGTNRYGDGETSIILFEVGGTSGVSNCSSDGGSEGSTISEVNSSTTETMTHPWGSNYSSGEVLGKSTVTETDSSTTETVRPSGGSNYSSGGVWGESTVSETDSSTRGAVECQESICPSNGSTGASQKSALLCLLWSLVLPLEFLGYFLLKSY